MKLFAPVVAVCIAFTSSGCGQETEWFVNTPQNLAKETIANDVWHWYHMDGLEPQAIQRVEWNTMPAIGNRRWGYFIYYQGRLKDPSLVQSIKQSASKWERYEGLPTWAKSVPAWWAPEVALPSDIARKIAGVQELLFAKIVGDDVLVFCLKKPLDDAVLHEPK